MNQKKAILSKKLFNKKQLVIKLSCTEYTIIDMHTIDCERLLQLDNSDALVLAVLCDFKGRPNREVIRYIRHYTNFYNQLNLIDKIFNFS
ncbi:hypothetical protein TI05_17300 [Achromatium sp. WMS3]|nr:hypothetical protein TI05_17300 [Achromatium sp. WMS3]